MKSGTLVKIFLAISLIAILAVEKSSQNVAQFAAMIRHTTRRRALDFNKYGNWCGKGGGGPVLDRIDRCCYDHDKCWARLKSGTCFGRNLFTTPYNYDKVFNRRLTCGKNRWGSASLRRCKRALCECDKKCAYCFKANLKHYDVNNKH